MSAVMVYTTPPQDGIGFVVHDASCNYVAGRTWGLGPDRGGWLREVSSRADLGREVYGEEADSDHRDAFHFAPCCEDLPEEDES